MDAIIQARMTSKRFPGKVTALLNGKTLIANIIDRLQHCNRVNQIYVAIPDNDESRNLVDLEQVFDVTVVDAAPEDDVTLRFLQVAEFYGIDHFVRVCADAPFLQSWLVDYAIDEFYNFKGDYLVTTGFPQGMNVEIVSTRALKRVYPLMTDEEKEHVTLYFERHFDQMHCLKLDLSHLSVDTVSDLERVREVSRYGL